MAILTKVGRAELANALKLRPIYLAWGRGNDSWGNQPPSESTNSTHLTHPIGYRRAKVVAFCDPDEQGEIKVPSGNFTLSNTPTSHLFCQFSYDFEDGLSETIRELGIMVGTTAKASIPEGKDYLTLDEVEESGSLLLLEHRPALYRDQGIRESFEFVISF